MIKKLSKLDEQQVLINESILEVIEKKYSNDNLDEVIPTSIKEKYLE